MAKINIPFNNKDYSVDESSLSTAANLLKSHLLNVMSGSGATISLGGTAYNVDSAKLSAATSAFISHLGTIAGNGYKVVVNGVEYNIASAKMTAAVSDLHAVLGGLQSGSGSTGESHDDAIAEGAYYANLATGTFYSEMPATCSDGDVYLYGDYMYGYNPSFDGWYVRLATEELGVLTYVPNYPVTDKNQTKYDQILSSINGKPIIIVSGTFGDCTSLTEAPIIPNSVKIMNHAFEDCTSLTGIIEINANPSEYGGCFLNVDMSKITLTGSSTMLNEIGATGLNYTAQ